MANDVTEVRTRIAALLPRLRRFARTLCRTPEDADDLVQMAVEKALTRTDQWTPGTRLESWMFRIMQTTWIDELRARERRSQTFVQEDEGEHVGVASPGSPSAIAVRRAVARLGEDQRAVVGLVLVEGFAYQEAADVLGIPVGTLTSRLARAREALQAMLGDGP